MMMMHAAWQSMLTKRRRGEVELIDISCITQIQRLCSINVVL